MKKDIIQHIYLHLERKGLLSEDDPVTDDTFIEKLYTNNDERKRLLKSLISLFSEDYRSDVQKTVNLDNVLAQKIYELEFVAEEKRFHFVLGKCTKEEQQVVYEKMFKALDLVLIAQEHSPNKFSSSLLTGNLTKPGTELSVCKLNKLSKKKFNLEQAVKNLEIACNTVENASQFMNQQRHSFQQISQPKMEDGENEESKFIKLSSNVESFKLMIERHISLPSECMKDNPVPELGTAVGELHSALQVVADCIKSLPPEGTEPRKKFDVNKMLAQAGEMEKSSALSKCFSEGIILDDGGTIYQE